MAKNLKVTIDSEEFRNSFRPHMPPSIDSLENEMTQEAKKNDSTLHITVQPFYEETAGFIYMHAECAENVDELAQLVAEEYGIEPAEVLEDVRNVVLTLQKKGILL